MAAFGSAEGSGAGVAGDRRHLGRRMCAALVVLLCLAALLSLTYGATEVTLGGVLGKLLSGEPLTIAERIVFFDIRLPRLILGICVGAALAVAGAVMQGLFRNPLADPGLLGVSAGASLGAVSAIVLGPLLPATVLATLGGALIPVAAFVFAWATMWLLYVIATRRGRTSVATMLLGGIAIAALAFALTGFLVFRADDMQLRELTFWQLGSLTGATWPKVAIAGPVILIATLIALTLAKGLNGLALGEATARHIGVDTQMLKRVAIFTVALATSAAVAVSGGIGFIGIVVPHILRLATGPDHSALLVNAGLLGAVLLVVADVISRVVVAPAELPIGIVMAILGAPVFLWILLGQRNNLDMP